MLWSLFVLLQIYIRLWWEQSYILYNYLKWVLLFFIISWTVATYIATLFLLLNGLFISFPCIGARMISENLIVTICFWVFVGVFVSTVLVVSINAMIRQFKGIRPPEDEIVLNKIAHLKGRIEELERNYKSLPAAVKTHGKKRK